MTHFFFWLTIFLVGSLNTPLFASFDRDLPYDEEKLTRDSLGANARSFTLSEQEVRAGVLLDFKTPSSKVILKKSVQKYVLLNTRLMSKDAYRCKISFPLEAAEVVRYGCMNLVNRDSDANYLKIKTKRFNFFDTLIFHQGRTIVFGAYNDSGPDRSMKIQIRPILGKCPIWLSCRITMENRDDRFPQIHAFQVWNGEVRFSFIPEKTFIVG